MQKLQKVETRCMGFSQQSTCLIWVPLRCVELKVINGQWIVEGIIYVAMLQALSTPHMKFRLMDQIGNCLIRSLFMVIHAIISSFVKFIVDMQNLQEVKIVNMVLDSTYKNTRHLNGEIHGPIVSTFNFAQNFGCWIGMGIDSSCH